MPNEHTSISSRATNAPSSRHQKPSYTMQLISLLYTYKNPILQITLSLATTLILTFLNFPVRLLQGLHTYILPDNIGNQSGVRAAIRRPGTTETSLKRNKSKEKFEFDENNAQIFRLQLVDDHLRSRLYFTEYRDVLICFCAAGSSFVLHSVLVDRDGYGYVFTSLLGLVAMLRILICICKISCERSASKRSEKQISVILGLLGFGVVFYIFDFENSLVALFAGLMAGFMFMPAAKSARSFWLGTDQLRWNLSIISCGGFGRMLLYANALLSVFACLLWVNPLVAIFINEKTGANLGGRIRGNENLVGHGGMSRADFVKFRIWCLLGSGILQIITLRPNLQMFLNEAVLSWYQRLHASKVPDLDFSRAKIFLHNYYLCLAVQQFLVPPLLVLLSLGLSQIEGNLMDTSPFVCNFVPCSAFVKEVALFMSWWITFVWSILTLLTMVAYRCGYMYVS